MKKYFEKSWKNYTKHFSQIGYIIALFIFLPQLLALIIDFVVKNEALNITISIVTALIGLLATITFISLAYHKKTLSQALTHARKLYLKFFVTSFILGLALMCLFLLLIIPGIIFMVFWFFTVYAIVCDNAKIFEAFGKSFQTVKGKWWRTLGYIIVTNLISLAVLLPVILVAGLVSGIIMLGSVGVGIFLFSLIVVALSGILSSYWIFFFTEVYRDWRHSSSKTTKR